MPPPPPPPLPPHNSYNPYNPHMLEANGQHQVKPELPIVVVCLNVINTVTQLLIGAVLFCAISFANSLTLLTPLLFPKSLSTHIYLCVIGYVLLMSQAILSFNNHAGWAYSLKYPEKKWIHAIMQTLGSILAIVGSIIRIADTGGHFRSPHAVTGIIAMVLTALSLVGGILNFIIPAKTSTVLYKTTHACTGSLTMTVAYISLSLGFNDMYKYYYTDKNANLAITLTVFALAGILISAFSKTIRRILK